jgi:hypothetical protein
MSHPSALSIINSTFYSCHRLLYPESIYLEDCTLATSPELRPGGQMGKPPDTLDHHWTFSLV